MESTRIRVAIWTSTFQAGGTERQMAHLVRGLDPRRFEVHALCFAARGCWLEMVAERAGSVVEFPIGSFTSPRTWRELTRYARWCREHAIDVVVTSDFYTNVFGLSGAALAGVPVRIGGRRELNTDKSLAKLALQRTAYATAHRVIANSRAAAARLRAEGVFASRIAVVPNGIDDAAFARGRKIDAIRRAITVANLRPEKGHDILIEALARLPASTPLHVIFAGDGPCRPALERQVARRGLADRVQFLGECHDIASVLRQADVFVLPSHTEAFPNSIMEAMAAGLPVVATNVGGIPELVEDGVSGLLVRPGDPQALADAIARLVNDPAKARALADAARDVVRRRYSLANMLAAFTDLFELELSRRAVSAHRRTHPAAVRN